MTDFDGVIFDLGGVVCESPLHVIADHERRNGIPAGTVNRTVMETGSDGAWARRERGELDLVAFCEAFGAECAARGADLDVAELMARIDREAVPRPAMVDAVQRVSESGRSVAALTNNWIPLSDGALTGLFDVVVESSVEGVRKPDPAIYRIVLERLATPAERTVFLDDIGGNLKPARAMGMTTIKVVDPEAALDELWTVLGLQP